MKRSVPHARGGATVETVFGILVLIPVIFYGIHFTELGIASMRVTEAAAAPVWEATARPMHVTGSPGSYPVKLVEAIRDATMSAKFRYGFAFEGRMKRAISSAQSTVAQGYQSPPFRQILTVAGDMQVGCSHVSASAGPLLAYSPMLFPGFSLLIPDTNGLACVSEAKAVNMIPETFMNIINGGFFQENLNRHPQQYTKLCPIGRPDGWGGPCRGAFAMMLDDWGLGNQDMEAEACTLTFGTWSSTIGSMPCENRNYYAVARGLFEAQTLPFSLAMAPHRKLVAATLGATPALMASDTSFYMSFRGDETMFETVTPSTDFPNDFMVWSTTPFLFPLGTYSVSWAIRSKCYLGLSGC